MGTYDAYWDLTHEDERKVIETVGYHVILDNNKCPQGNRYASRVKAIQAFVATHGHKIFEWEDFKRKGFSVMYVDIKEVKQQMAQLQGLLKNDSE